MIRRLRTLSFCSMLAAASGGAVLAAALPAEAQVLGCRKDDKDLTKLLVIDDERTLRPRLFKRFRGRIAESEPSTSGSYVGALVVDPESKKDGLWTFTLNVINSKGRTVYTVPKAQGFQFSPDDRYVAVTTGIPYEGAGGFKPEGTVIVDLKRKRQWSVPELKDATEVDWTTLPDEGLTLMAKKPTGKQKVWKYRLANRRARATQFKSIHFSPDGEYYFMTPRETIEAGMCKPGDKDDSCIRAFSRRNKQVRLGIKKRVRRTLGWTGTSGHELLVRDGYGDQEEGMQVDLATGRKQILKEKLDRKWKVRRGMQIIEERPGRLRLKKLIDSAKGRKLRREKLKKKSGY